MFTKQASEGLWAWYADPWLGDILGDGRIFLNPQKYGGDGILHLCGTGHSQVCLLTAEGLVDFLL